MNINIGDVFIDRGYPTYRIKCLSNGANHHFEQEGSGRRFFASADYIERFYVKLETQKPKFKAGDVIASDKRITFRVLAFDAATDHYSVSLPYKSEIYSCFSRDFIDERYQLETPAPAPPQTQKGLVSVSFLGLNVAITAADDNTVGAATQHHDDVYDADELDATIEELKILSATIRRLNAVVGAK